MRSRLKRLAKKLAYLAGPLPIRHAIEHRQTLTVVMFHRVLDRDDSRWREANPTDTVSTGFFADCLRFFRRHYSVVSLADVAAAAGRQRALPSRSLLITFDDGWADNLRFAAPLLRAAGLPAVVFLAAEPIVADDAAWWQERVFSACRTGALALTAQDDLAVRAAAQGAAGGWIDRAEEPAVLSLVSRLATVEAGARRRLLEALPDREQGQRMMLTASELATIKAAGVDLGVHGFSHAPLTMLADAGADLARARATLAAAAPGVCALDVLAYPHGRYDASVQRAAEELGFELIFTSDPAINCLGEGGFIDGRSIGRIPIDEQLLGDGHGRLRSEEMATSLFLRTMQ